MLRGHCLSIEIAHGRGSNGLVVHPPKEDAPTKHVRCGNLWFQTPKEFLMASLGAVARVTSIDYLGDDKRQSDGTIKRMFRGTAILHCETVADAVKIHDFLDKRVCLPPLFFLGGL